MAKIRSAISGLRDRLSNPKHEVGHVLPTSHHKETRGGPEKDIAHLIATEEQVPREEDEDDGDSHAQSAKSLHDFLDNDDPPEIKRRYGILPLMQSQEEAADGGDKNDWTPLPAVNPEMIGREITFRARVHFVRNLSAKLAFIIFRSGTTTVQGVLNMREDAISENMVRWAEHIRPGSIAIVRAKVQKPEQEVQATSAQHVELLIEEMHLVSVRETLVPFSVYEAEAATDNHSITHRVRLNNRILDLRTPTSQAVFRVQSAVCRTFRTYLDNHDFLEIHTPKLQAGATEGGADVFKVNYFGRPAFLAQSPQLAKQMCISADFERVYEIGPVFRAGM